MLEECLNEYICIVNASYIVRLSAVEARICCWQRSTALVYVCPGCSADCEQIEYWRPDNLILNS